jgi:membrane fusion protein (multidrug efflux system)
MLIGAGAAWYVYEYWTIRRFIESTDDAYIGGDVTVIAPKVSGFIARVAVTDNQLVREGDLLIRLDDRDYRAALARTEAMVAGQQATLANLDAPRRLQEAAIREAQAKIAAADAETARAGRRGAVRHAVAHRRRLGAGVPEGRGQTGTGCRGRSRGNA